jgi:hypothetical protein
MNEKETSTNPVSFPGMITKAAQLENQELNEAELRAINKHTLSPLTADDVFTFKAVLCDNEIDRQSERFTLKALEDLKKLFIGKTVIKDHSWSANDQVARIYATELVTSEKANKSGEPSAQLVAYCYMVKTASNADLIAEIKGGIKKEGSVGFRASSVICSICGTDNAKSYCRHFPGKSYEKEGGSQQCVFTLASVSDAYEFSLVAVPAQKAAGVRKSYTGETVEAPATEPENTSNVAEKHEDKDTLTRVRLMETHAKNNINTMKNYQED